jgi:hypothetical protein
MKSGIQPGEAYTVTTGDGFERPAFVCIELPGRSSPRRASSDPLGLADYRPRPQDEFPPEASGYLANVPLLLRLDAEGLAKADTLASILLGGTNRTVAAEVRKVLGFRPDESVRSFMLALLTREPEDGRLRRGLALLDERKAPSRDAFLRQYIPGLKGDNYGIHYVRRVGWTGSRDDVPALIECIGRVQDTRLKLAIAQAAMTLGDMALAEDAAALAAAAPADARMPVDALLLGAPELAASARDRLAVLMKDPADHVRWGAVREMGFLSMPPESPEALEFLILALGDRSPQIRLEAAGLLGRLAGSRTVLERAMGRESVPFVRDAIAETLADLK